MYISILMSQNVSYKYTTSILECRLRVDSTFFQVSLQSSACSSKYKLE